MQYTVIINGQSYDLPKKTMKVVEEMDKVAKIDSVKGLSIRDKFKALYDFIVSLVGKEARVIADIDNFNGVGDVIIAGQEWTARSDDSNELIPTGTLVEILKIEGVKLIVKKKEGEK